MSETIEDKWPLPRANPYLAGHDSAEQFLLESLNSGRLAHAWILAGMQGIGKATMAYRFARFLLSGEGDAAGGGLFGEATPITSMEISAEHPVFSRVASGGHSDLLIVQREYDEKKGKVQGEIPVDTVRKIAPFLRKTAAEGGWRVVIVDDAETMNRNGQNAILKILEEPPEKAIILLVTNNPGSLLPTIRSRSRLLPMETLDEQTIISLLDRYQPELPFDDKLALARLSDGSIGRALDLIEHGGLDLYRDLMDLLGSLPNLNLLKVHELSDKLSRAGSDDAYKTVTKLLEWWLARVARYGARGEAVPEIVAGETALVQRLTARGAKNWLDAWDETHQLFRQGDFANLDKKQVMLTAFQSLAKAAA